MKQKKKERGRLARIDAHVPRGGAIKRKGRKEGRNKQKSIEIEKKSIVHHSSPNKIVFLPRHRKNPG